MGRLDHAVVYEMYKKTGNYAEVAREFGVTGARISQVVKGFQKLNP